MYDRQARCAGSRLNEWGLQARLWAYHACRARCSERVCSIPVATRAKHLVHYDLAVSPVDPAEQQEPHPSHFVALPYVDSWQVSPSDGCTTASALGELRTPWPAGSYRQHYPPAPSTRLLDATLPQCTAALCLACLRHLQPSPSGRGEHRPAHRARPSACSERVS